MKIVVFDKVVEGSTVVGDAVCASAGGAGYLDVCVAGAGEEEDDKSNCYHRV